MARACRSPAGFLRAYPTEHFVLCSDLLAKAAGIHHNTVNSFETERYAGRPETIAAMRTALEKAGVEFTNGKGPGVRQYAPDMKPHPSSHP